MTQTRGVGLLMSQATLIALVIVLMLPGATLLPATVTDAGTGNRSTTRKASNYYYYYYYGGDDSNRDQQASNETTTTTTANTTTMKPNSQTANDSAHDVNRTSTWLMTSPISAAKPGTTTTPSANTTNTTKPSNISHTNTSSTTASPDTTGGKSVENGTSNTTATSAEPKGSTRKPEEEWWAWADAFTWEIPHTSTGPSTKSRVTETNTQQRSEAWENDVTTGSRDWNADAGYGTGDIPDGLTVAMLVMIVVIGTIGIAVISGVYCVRAYRHRLPSRNRYDDYDKPGDTDPLLMTPPP